MRFLLTKLSHFFIFFLGLSVTAPLSYEDADLVQRAKFFGTVLPMVTYGSLNPESQSEDFYDIVKMRELLYQKTIDVSLIKEEPKDE